MTIKKQTFKEMFKESLFIPVVAINLVYAVVIVATVNLVHSIAPVLAVVLILVLTVSLQLVLTVIRYRSESNRKDSR